MSVVTYNIPVATYVDVWSRTYHVYRVVRFSRTVCSNCGSPLRFIREGESENIGWEEHEYPKYDDVYRVYYTKR